MIIYNQKRYGSKFVQTLFYNGENFEVEDDVYEIVFYQSKIRPEHNNYKIFHSATIDLNIPEDEIFKNFDKDCRYDVKRSERDGVITFQKKDNEITDEDLLHFYKFYNAFARQKRLPKVNKTMLEECRKQNNLIISYACDGTNQPIVYHVYLKDDYQCRLQYSCSLYRNKKINGQIVGRSNRLLQYKDICYAKKIGLKILDLGGLGKEKQVQDISRFKEEFGGSPKDYYIYSKINNKNKSFLTKLKDIAKKILKKD